MSGVVSLADADPDLIAGVPDEDLALARRALVRPLYEIPAGRWAPELLRAHEGAFAFLVIDGAILRQMALADRECAQLLGPGDVLHEPTPSGVLDTPVTWTALQPSSIAVLDGRFTAASRRWPTLALNLQRRLLDQGDRTALHAATAQLPRVERRLLALFWQLADRWGTVTPFGVEVPLHLTHEVLGRLVGAQRPTVTLALKELADAALVARGPKGGWLLAGDSYEELRSAARPLAASAHTS